MSILNLVMQKANAKLMKKNAEITMISVEKKGYAMKDILQNQKDMKECAQFVAIEKGLVMRVSKAVLDE